MSAPVPMGRAQLPVFFGCLFFCFLVTSSFASVVAVSVASSVAFPVASFFFLSLILLHGRFLLLSLPYSPSFSLLLLFVRSLLQSACRWLLGRLFCFFVYFSSFSFSLSPSVSLSVSVSYLIFIYFNP